MVDIGQSFVLMLNSSHVEYIGLILFFHHPVS
jgi:hypothetical protein